MLLALDTSLNACSVAVYGGAEACVLASECMVMERGHAEALGPMVERVLERAGIKPAALSRIATTRGPGTFTGVRIGLAYAKGLSLALKLPLIGIDTLQATAAAHAATDKPVLVVHHAGGTGLFYWAAYEQGKIISDAPAIGDAATLVAFATGKEGKLVGSAGNALMGQLPGFDLAQGSPWPEAAGFAAMAATLVPEDHAVMPLYLRPPDAKPSVAALQATAQLRHALPDDYATLAKLHGACFSKGWNAADFASMMAVPGAGALMVHLAGVAYGFVQYQWVAGEAEINTICVLPSYRGQGFGSDLMKGLEAALAPSTQSIFLEVAANNEAALRLYQHHGFSEIGIRRKYYENGTDALMLKKTLGV